MSCFSMYLISKMARLERIVAKKGRSEARVCRTGWLPAPTKPPRGSEGNRVHPFGLVLRLAGFAKWHLWRSCIALVHPLSARS